MPLIGVHGDFDTGTFDSASWAYLEADNQDNTTVQLGSIERTCRANGSIFSGKLHVSIAHCAASRRMKVGL